jgi:hypothetical protein
MRNLAQEKQMRPLAIALVLLSVSCSSSAPPICGPGELNSISNGALRLLFIDKQGCASVYNRASGEKLLSFHTSEEVEPVDAHSNKPSRTRLSADGGFVVFGSKESLNILKIADNRSSNLLTENWQYIPHLSDYVYTCSEGRIEERLVTNLSVRRTLPTGSCEFVFVTPLGPLTWKGRQLALVRWDGSGTVAVRTPGTIEALYADERSIRIGYDGGEVFLDAMTLIEKRRILYPGYTAHAFSSGGLGTRVWKYGKSLHVYRYDKELREVFCTSPVALSPDGLSFVYVDSYDGGLRLHRIEDERIELISAPTAHNSV